ncbi:hypothetical protein [Streptomyces sp. NRRL S-31]|nr:hypothetical protein [Streptomyces sp. NRRL S-31]
MRQEKCALAESPPVPPGWLEGPAAHDSLCRRTEERDAGSMESGT